MGAGQPVYQDHRADEHQDEQEAAVHVDLPDLQMIAQPDPLGHHHQDHQPGERGLAEVLGNLLHALPNVRRSSTG